MFGKQEVSYFSTATASSKKALAGRVYPGINYCIKPVILRIFFGLSMDLLRINIDLKEESPCLIRIISIFGIALLLL